MSDPLLFVDDRPVASQDLLGLLRRNGQLTSLLQEWILEDCLKDVSIPADQQQQFLAEFRSQQGLESEEAYVAFLQQRMLNEDLVLQMLSRPHKVVGYREERWGPRANSLYLQRKDRYDRILYRRLQAGNADVMQEVYFRLKDGEENWESLARQINPSDPEATGLVGPVAVNQVEPELLNQLRAAGEGKLLRPLQIGGNTVVAQLEEVLPSEFNEELRTQLLRESFDEWLADECSRMLQKVTFPA
jgi:hypothetical protein